MGQEYFIQRNHSYSQMFVIQHQLQICSLCVIYMATMKKLQELDLVLLIWEQMFYNFAMLQSHLAPASPVNSIMNLLPNYCVIISWFIPENFEI